MSKIYVNLNGMRSANYNIPALSSKADNIKRAVGLLRYRVADDVAGRYKIRQRLNDSYNTIDRIKEQIDELYAVTNSCIEQYAAAEQVNSKNIDAFD